MIVLGLIYSFVHLYRELLALLGVSTPAVFALTIMRARGLSLAVSQRIQQNVPVSSQVSRRDVIEVPVVYTQDLQAEADSVIRRLNDRLWNSFAYDRCFMIREDNTLLVD